MSSSNAAASSSTAPVSATTIRSLDRLHTHLHPDAPAHYLTHHVATALLRRGFQGAEAGALTEIERLLEHRVSLCPSHSQGQTAPADSFCRYTSCVQGIEGLCASSRPSEAERL